MLLLFLFPIAPRLGAAHAAFRSGGGGGGFSAVFSAAVALREMMRTPEQRVVRGTGRAPMAEGSDDPFPEGLLAHAELQLRRAYEHSAVERRREVADRTGAAAAASTSAPADVAAMDPPSPSGGIVAALDALRRIAVESATRAGDANEGEDDGADAKRRRKGTSAGAAERGESDGASDGPTRHSRRNLATSAPARFNRDVRSLTTALRGDWTTSYELIVARTIDASHAVARAESHAARSRWRRETIVSRHRELRATVAASRTRQITDESPPRESPPMGALRRHRSRSAARIVASSSSDILVPESS